MSSREPVWGARLVSVLAASAVLAGAVALRPRLAATAGPTPADFEAACAAGEPFAVAADLRGVARETSIKAFEAEAPTVLLFSDTPANHPQYSLATLELTGAVFGLAYRRGDQAVYAAAYHKVQLPFGPGGPGAVYRIDLDTGAVTLALTVPGAGTDHHQMTPRFDAAASPFTSRVSLGDIDLSGDESQLFVVNLADRRIYRFAMPSGALLGSFDHGAAAEPWAASARPFGLAWHEGHLYHAVVESAEESLKLADLRALVYRSRDDGSGMTLVATLDLAYPRGEGPGGRLEWQPWRDNYEMRNSSILSPYPMPLVTDIVFDGQGGMVLGLRDRRLDSMPHHLKGRVISAPELGRVGIGVGDILYGQPQGSGWVFDPANEHFSDRMAGAGDESALGGLAELPGGQTTMTGGYVSDRYTLREGAYWFRNLDGNVIAEERLGRSIDVDSYRAGALHVSRAYADDEQPGEYEIRGAGTDGDLEVLCGPAMPPPTVTSSPSASPTLASTPTSAPPTLSPRPPASATARPSPVPTRTATPQPKPLYLPLAVSERCDPQHQRADVALVIDTSSSMAGRKLEDAKAAAAAFVGQTDLAPGRDQVAVVRYDTEAELACRLTNARAVIEAAIRNLTSRSGTHIDKGLRLAWAELQSGRHLERNLRVIVLLTDGMQTGTPNEELRAPAEVRAADVLLYAVGLGADVDAATLREMAGDDSRYHFAPDSADLARIYAEIASDILCPAPAGGFWPAGG